MGEVLGIHIGGTEAELTSGKFTNGARTVAYAQTFNKGAEHFTKRETVRTKRKSGVC